MGLAGINAWSITVVVLFSLFVSGPHYGATILRVYEHRGDRRKYAFFALWATAALCGLFVAGLHSALIGSLLVTAYATWSPWHFSGQNYGLALMFLRRRGIPVEPRAKRALYASFVLSFALAILVLHGEHSVPSLSAVPISNESVYRFLSIGLPSGFLQVAVPLTAGAYLLTLVGVGVLLRRHARLRDLGPAACLVLAQSLWFALPAALPLIANLPLHGLAFTPIWVSAAHGVQYLWVTSYYARREDPSLRMVPYLGRALLAGSTVTIFPAVIFAPALLGTVPWDVGLAILLISVVNLHHFILDGAIWKLRDGRVARLLLKDTPGKVEPIGPSSSSRSWFRPVVAVLGVASLAVSGFDVWQREVSVHGAGGDLGRVLQASERLAWIGREPPGLHSQVGRILAGLDRPEAAIAEYRRSLDLYPTAEAWIGLGEVYAGRGEWEEASRAFAAALEVSPDHVPALVHSSRAWLQLGRPELALQALERAQRIAPGNAQIRREIRSAITAQRQVY